MKNYSKYVGFDVHKETIAVGIAKEGQGEVVYYGEVANTPEAITKLVRKMISGKETVSFCYEAGPLRNNIGCPFFLPFSHLTLFSTFPQ